MTEDITNAQNYRLNVGIMIVNRALPKAANMSEQEFSCFDWVDADWLVEQIPAFEKEVYRTIVRAFRALFP